MPNVEDDLNATMMVDIDDNASAARHAEQRPMVTNPVTQPAPGPVAVDTQQLMAHMSAMMSQMMQQQASQIHALTSEVRAINERVNQMQRPPGPSVSTVIASGAPLGRPQTVAGTSNDGEPVIRMPSTTSTSSSSMRSAAPAGGATSWNGSTASQVSSAATLTHKPFELPVFAGMPSQWPMFISAYRQSTAAFGYSPLQNTFRLQRCLEGEARLAVESLLMDPRNVEELIETLELRFGRPEQLARDQIEKMRDYPPIDENHFEQLIEFSSHVSNAVAFLDTDASRHVLSESSLLTAVMNKLPQSRKYEWLMYTETLEEARPTVRHFARWLRTIARRVSRLPMETMDAAPVTHRNANAGSSRDTKRIMLNSADRCGVCDRQHKAADCDELRQQTVKERWETVRRNRMCFGCLRQGHAFGRCNSRRGNGYHAMLYDHDRSGQETPTTQQRGAANRRCTCQGDANNNDSSRDATASAVSAPRPANPFVGSAVASRNQFPLLFRVVPVVLHGPDRSVNTYALLDEGSSVSMMDAEFADDLGLDGPARLMDLQWIGSHTTSTPSKMVSLAITGAARGCARFNLVDVCTVRHLDLPTQSVVLSLSDARHEHLRGLPIATYENATPKILIGLDHCHLGAATKTIIGPHGGPIAAKTSLGWIVYGRQDNGIDGRIFHCRAADERYAALEHTMSEYHATECFGVMAPVRTLESDEDARARALLASTTVRVGERFQTGLLWRSDDEQLPDSMPMALQRYSTVARKMRRDSTYAQLYVRQIADFVAKGYARRLSPDEAAARTDRTWYLPHFGVQSPYKPGKLRIVFDAAATVDGRSLNSVLLKGPDLNQPLFGILMQFRMRPVGVCADIAEMFLQIGMQPTDRAAQRFLWRADGGSPPDVYQMDVMTFGATCSPTSAQYVKNRNALEHENEFPEAAEAVRKMHYVDDYVASFTTEEEAARITADVVEVHRRGGFVLRGFVSNSHAVLETLGAAPTDQSLVVDMQLDPTACQKILGLRWQTHDDTFVFQLQFDKVDGAVLSGERAPTKREILSAMMSVYDPFGFLADVMLPTKTMIQELWRLGAAWDTPVPTPIEMRWKSWCDVLADVRRFRIPRCYSPNLVKATEVQLHCFADASEEAFAAVIYWRIRHGGECTTAFVAGKTRCAPLKTLTIPRLELQAAVLATRLHQTIKANHNLFVTQTIFWTDSRTVLQWLRSTQRRFRPFVAHRVAEVLDSTHESQWRWLPTKDNVADDATRCRTPSQFDPESRWIRGPAFLRQDEDVWPVMPAVETGDDSDELPEEIRPRFAGATRSSECFIDVYRFSSFYRLSRAVGWALRFADNARARGRGMERRDGELTAEEVWAATEHLCHIAQREGFPAEYAALIEEKPIARSSAIRVLMPYIDERLTMRVYGRTDAADPAYLPISAQRPILLPHNHRVTELIVIAHHARMSHQFEGGTICSVRRHYWVPNLRTLVRRIRRDCRACKIRAARPTPPVAGQLPPDRMAPFVPPFSYCGVDYFGHVLVTIGRRKEKRWVCMFTCLTIRAVHMELAEDLSTDAFLTCLRNFCNLRGVPKRLRSDRGTNFVGADNELKRMGEVFNNDEIRREVSVRGIDWVFNCPANPEAGGAWERLVQSTKRVLAVILKEMAPRVETLRSLVIEAANILNSRPLTHVPVSPEDNAPLTPNDFLLGHINVTTTTDEFESRQLCARKQWRVLTQLKNHFWARWVTEYLPVLTGRDKKHDNDHQLKEGDLVLICDANQSRGEWLRGKVERAIRGTDGRVRVAEIRTKDGLLKRPVTKLAVLQVE